MSKFIVLIVSVILLVAVFSVPIINNWVTNLYSGISLLNVGFFSEMPAWFNFLFGTPIVAILIAFARSFRK